MKKSFLICLCILLVLLVGCSAAEPSGFFSDAQLEAMQKPSEEAADILGLTDGDISENPQFRSNDAYTAYEKKFKFCGRECNTRIMLLNTESKKMNYFCVYEILECTDENFDFIRKCFDAIYAQFGETIAYGTQEYGTTTGSEAPDYDALFADFAAGEDGDLLNFQWQNPHENVGLCHYTVSRRGNEMLLEIPLYMTESLLEPNY